MYRILIASQGSVIFITFCGFWQGLGRISSGRALYPSKSWHSSLSTKAEKMKGKNLAMLVQLEYKLIFILIIY